MVNMIIKGTITYDKATGLFEEYNMKLSISRKNMMRKAAALKQKI